MKKINRLFFVFSIALLTACSEGIPGPQGPPGEPGESFIGTVFQLTGDFTAEDDFQLFFEFPSTFQVYESDAVLVYILWEVTSDNEGNPLNIWRLLPQTVVLDEGILQYNYDNTSLDVRIFLEGTLDLNNLLPAEALDQEFRIVILPADYAKNTEININNYNSLLKLLKTEKIEILY